MTDFIRVQLECGCVSTIIKNRDSEKYRSIWVLPEYINPKKCPRKHGEKDFLQALRGEDKF